MLMNEMLRETGFRLANPSHNKPECGATGAAWKEGFAESYLRKFPITPAGPFLDWTWWISHAGNRPNWDLLSHITNDSEAGLLMFEAKAHLGEMNEQYRKTAPNPNKPDSLENDRQIRLRLSETCRELGQLGLGEFKLSVDDHYQLANRLAYLNKLASLGIPTVLVYLGFTNSPDWHRDPLTSGAHWSRVVDEHIRPIIPTDFVNKRRQRQGAAPMWLLVRSLDATLVSEPLEA
jgi:hypothetical protein